MNIVANFFIGWMIFLGGESSPNLVKNLIIPDIYL